MRAAESALRADGASAYEAHRGEYLAQLVAPMDDMWAAFADAGTHRALTLGNEVVGSCAVDDDRQLLRFYVRPAARHRSRELLEQVLVELDVERIIACTVDPAFLSVALDLAVRSDPHTLLFARTVDPEGPGLTELFPATPADHGRIVDFQAEAIGAPRGFLEAYVDERLKRGEMFLAEAGGGALTCAGELRRDPQQPGVAHLGVIVHAAQRGRGVATRTLTSLAERARSEGLAPHCSTECSNIGARRAIERAGFRADHRLLRIAVAR